jgi:hypothetical protein
MEVWVSVHYSQSGTSESETIDYSEENIIFDFQENNKLVVIGNIPDVLVVFDDFQEGEHFYEFHVFDDSCYWEEFPGPNLEIDKPEIGSWERCYFCSALSDKETMKIGKIDWEKKGNDYYMWGYTFIKLN